METTAALQALQKLHLDWEKKSQKNNPHSFSAERESSSRWYVFLFCEALSKAVWADTPPERVVEPWVPAARTPASSTRS
jgi:hypothetical protein